MDNDNTLLTFPCPFPIKIIGKSSDEFEGIVLGILNQHAPDLGEGAITLHYSKHDKYISITATINATSREQLDNVYRALSSHPDVIMAL